MDIMAGIVAATQAIDIAKALRSVERTYDAVSLKAEISDLMDKLLDAKAALQDARQELGEKESRIAALIAANHARAECVTVRGMRFRPSSARPGEPQGSPYCIRCDEIDGLLVTTVDRVQGGGVVCPECDKIYAHAPMYLWDQG